MVRSTGRAFVVNHPSLPARTASWIWHNLFGTLLNTALTLLAALLVYRIAASGLDWLVFRATIAPAEIRTCIDNGGACWAFLQDKWRLILFGMFPYEEQWRAALALVIFIGLVVTSCVPTTWATPERRRWLAALWVVGAGILGVLMLGGLGLRQVEIRLWSGLPLTVMLASVGMFLAFFLALGLALGRRSRLPVIRWLCVIYIELIRGVPLISLLFMANFLLPIVMPAGMTVPNLLRAQVAFVLFFAAYMAETIRGGLQAIPESQYRAAKALGLGYWQSMAYVILPQALRTVIPSLVNIFIGGFKDTSLVVVISMLDLLGTANSAKADTRWLGLFMEAYFFIAMIYLAVCATMSWYSRWLERRLAAGERR